MPFTAQDCRYLLSDRLIDGSNFINECPREGIKAQKFCLLAFFDLGMTEILSSNGFPVNFPQLCRIIVEAG